MKTGLMLTQDINDFFKKNKGDPSEQQVNTWKMMALFGGIDLASTPSTPTGWKAWANSINSKLGGSPDYFEGKRNIGVAAPGGSVTPKTSPAPTAKTVTLTPEQQASGRFFISPSTGETWEKTQTGKFVLYKG